MKSKKITLILLLIIIIAGVVFFVARNKNNPVDEQKAFANKCAVDMQAAKSQTMAGAVEAIDAQSLTVRFGQIKKVMKLNNATRVMLMDKTKKKTAGQISDVKQNDTVTVEYDKDSMNVTSITVAKN